jgi:hypothetical protein
VKKIEGVRDLRKHSDSSLNSFFFENVKIVSSVSQHRDCSVLAAHTILETWPSPTGNQEKQLSESSQSMLVVRAGDRV